LNEQPVETTLYSLDERAPDPTEDWGSERLSLLRVGTLIVGDRRELCLVKSVSVGGMMVRAYSHIEPGTRVSIELKQDEPISATARWSRHDCVGVSFDMPIDVLGLISTSDDGPRPRMPRIEIHCTAWVREGATVYRTRAVDVSQGGIKVTSPKELPLDAEVIVTMAGLAPIPGMVRWNNGDSYGIGFHRSLALPALVAWIQEQRELASRSRAAG
jgi:hypothetical protein